MTIESSNHGRIDLLDYLRFAAALAVVCYHYLFNGIVNGKISSLERLSPAADMVKYGYLGVPLFFLISGFVIYNSVAGKTADQFAVGRAVRLYPAFWAAMCLTTIVSLLWGGARFDVTLPQFIANLTMVPTLLGQPEIDGVYWTLAVELAFYAAVFLVMCLGGADRMHTLMPAWAVLMLIVALAAPSLARLHFLGGYYSLFAGGAIIASFRRPGFTWFGAVGLACAWYLSLMHAAAVAQELAARKHVDFSLPLVMALISGFYLIFLALTSQRVCALKLPRAALAGGMTYPIYLVHAHIGYILLSRFATESNRWVAYAGVFTFVMTLAYALHVIVERRGKRFWRWLFDASAGALIRKCLALGEALKDALPGGRKGGAIDG